MKKSNKSFSRILSFLMAVVVSASMLPITTFAEEKPVKDSGALCVCTDTSVTQKCTEGSVFEACEACKENFAACVYVEPTCTCEVKCVPDENNSGEETCTICKEDAAACEYTEAVCDCKDVACAEGAVSATCAVCQKDLTKCAVLLTEGKTITEISALTRELFNASNLSEDNIIISSDSFTLPDTLPVMVEGVQGAVQVPVSWDVLSYADGDLPTVGFYIITASFPGNHLAESVEAPVLYVNIQSKGRMAGTGSDMSPLQITSEAHLRNLSELQNTGRLNKVLGYNDQVHMQLANDITLNGAWEGMGNVANPFTGVFDGNNKTISGLYGVGLFHRMKDATAKNLTLSNVWVVALGAPGAVGALAFTADNSTITNVYASGEVEGAVAGGLVGEQLGGSMEYCGSSVVVTSIGDDTSTGGLVGNSTGDLENCFATGDVRGEMQVGGLIGSASGSVTNCYATGYVYGTTSGGLVGLATDATIASCYALGTVVAFSATDAPTAGGLVGGAVSSTIRNSAALNEEINSIASPTLTPVIGRVVGKGVYGVILHNNVGFKLTMGMTSGGPVLAWTDDSADNDGASIDVDGLNNADRLNGRLPTDEWTTGGTNTLPILQDNGSAALTNQSDEKPAYLTTATGYFKSGNGTQTDPYVIETETQLRNLAQLVNAPGFASTYAEAFYVLGADITLTQEWIPIGTESNPFAGDFEGDSHTIKNLRGSNGLFGYVDGNANMINNVYLADVSIVNNDGEPTGGLVGWAFAENDDLEINGCVVEGTILGVTSTGGLVGLLETDGPNAVSINASIAKVNIEGDADVGGLIGKTNDQATIENSYTTGIVTGDEDVGGIVGYLGVESTVNGCYSIASVSGNLNVGGLVGFIDNSDGKITNNASFARNIISAQSSVGRIYGAVASGQTPTITNNHAFAGMLVNDEDVSGGGATNEDGADIAANDITGSDFATLGLFQGASWITFDRDLPKIDISYTQDTAKPDYLWDNVGTYFAGGNGTIANPYIIENETQLRNLAYVVNDNVDGTVMGGALVDGTSPYAKASYKLSASSDIKLVQEWTPIGTSRNPFTGTFDGNGVTISGLRGNNGMFGTAKHATIQRVTLINVNIYGSDNVGGLVGSFELSASAPAGGIVECQVTGTVIGDSYVGGLIGSGDLKLISSSSTTVDLMGTEYVGGLAGGLEGDTILKQSYASGSVKGETNVGGLIGELKEGTLVSDCYASGNVVAYKNTAGGLVGFVEGNRSGLYSSYAIGSVKADKNAGGIVGKATSPNASIQNNAAMGLSVEAVGDKTTAGRVIGNVTGTIDKTAHISGNIASSGIQINGKLPDSAVNASAYYYNNSIDSAEYWSWVVHNGLWITREMAVPASFWRAEIPNGMDWNTQVWKLADNKMPNLYIESSRGIELPGQSDNPILTENVNYYVAVANITDVPSETIEKTPLTLTSTVAPANATNKTIVWSITHTGTTGATITDGILNTTAAGTVVLKATIVNGETKTTDYVKYFSIVVSAQPVEPPTPIPPSTSGGGSGGSGSSNWTPPATPNVIGTTEGQLNLTTYNNYDQLLVDGLAKINERKPGTFINLDRVVDGKVVYRIKVNPTNLALVMKNDLPLGAHIAQDDAAVLAVTERFAKYYSNNIVALVYEQSKPLSVNAEFAAKLDLSKLNTKTLYVYSYDMTTNIYTRVSAPNYFVDVNGYTHITAPLGGAILLTDQPLIKK